jgi:hypothetical protein
MVPALHCQERYVVRQLGCIVARMDFHRRACDRLERQIALARDDEGKARLLRELLAQRRAEQQSVLDLRDGTAHLCGLLEVPGGA